MDDPFLWACDVQCKPNFGISRKWSKFRSDDRLDFRYRDNSSVGNAREQLSGSNPDVEETNRRPVLAWQISMG